MAWRRAEDADTAHLDDYCAINNKAQLAGIFHVS